MVGTAGAVASARHRAERCRSDHRVLAGIGRLCGVEMIKQRLIGRLSTFGQGFRILAKKERARRSLAAP
jgi:hypothetical protein